MDLTELPKLASQLEGPYKWYIIGGFLLLISIIFARLVFKTVKWLLLLLAIGALVFFAVTFLTTYFEGKSLPF